MKIRVSKKIVAAFLAVLMVITSIPIVSLASIDQSAVSTDPKVVATVQAMHGFEKRLMGGGRLKNVVDAYEAYVNCQKAIDAYVYGGETNALDVTDANGRTPAQALTAATGLITDFTPFTATSKTGTWPNNNGSSDEVIYRNLVYCGSADTDYVNVTASDGKSKMQIRFTPAVMMYDGEDGHEPLMPVMTVISGIKKGSYANRYFYSIVLTDNLGNSFKLTDNWKGLWEKGTNWDYGYQRYDSKAGKDRLGTSSASSSLNAQVQKSKLNGARGDLWPEGDTNVIKFDGKKADGTASFVSEDKFNPTMYTAITPTFTGYAGSSDTFTNNDQILTGASSKAIGVINYKAVMDAMDKASSSMITIDPINYSEGGLRKYVAAIEAATKWNPYQFFTSSTAETIENDVVSCTNAMSGIIGAMSPEETDIKENNSTYAKLRDAMSEAVRGTYADTNFDENGEQRYTEESWGEFVDAYKAAQSVMALCNDKGYTATNCELLASNLSAAKTNLDPLGDKIGTAELEAEIDTFYTYNESLFTADTYAAAVSAIDAAKVTVWGKVEDYGKKAKVVLKDNDDDRVFYNEALASVRNAIAGLRFSMDAVVMTDKGKYSLNSAIALRDTVTDTEVYYNWGTFTTAVGTANAYAEVASGTPFTDYDAQLQSYTDAVNALLTAFDNLDYSFVRYPNGYVVSTGDTQTMTTLTAKDQGQQDITFSYSVSGIVLKTTHDGGTAPYGKASVVFGTTIKDKNNNMLDSISINATQPKIADNGSILHANKSKTGTSTPNSIDGTTYSGCLEHNNFSLSNIKLTERTYNNVADQYFTYTDGTTETNADVAYSYDATTLLGNTEGASADPGRGGFFVKTNGGLATITLTGDFNYTFSNTSVVTLNRDVTVPASQTYQLGSTKFGAVTLYNCQNLFNFAYYDWFTSEMTGETIDTSCTVIDISYLTDLVDLCNKELEDGPNKYTESSWTDFKDALEGAQAPVKNLESMSAAAITKLAKDRYQDLWDKKEALDLKDMTSTFNYKDADGNDTTTVITTDFGMTIDMNAVNAIAPPVYSDNAFTYTFTGWSPEVSTEPMTLDKVYTAQYSSERKKIEVTFNYKDANGADTSTVIEVSYGEYIDTALVDAINTPTYMDDDYIYTFSGWSPEVAAEPATAPHTHTAQYSTEERVADFTAFDAALAAVNAKLANGTLSVSALSAAADTINAFNPNYTTYTAQQKAATKVSSQSAIDAQTAALNQIASDLAADALVIAAMDYSAYDAAEETGRAKYAVDDMYAAGDVSLPSRTQDVSILGKSVTAQVYSDQSVVNQLVADALNNRVIRTYTIYVDGVPCGIVQYGTQVVVDSKALLHANAVAADVDTAGMEDVAWYYSYSAPSTKNVQSNSKYMTTAPVFEFIVKGNTYLVTEKTLDQADNCYTVTFKAIVAGVTRTFDVVYTTDGTVTIPSTPAYAFYHCTKYIDAATKTEVTAGSTIDVTDNMTIAAFYTGNNAETYIIDFYDTETSFEDGPSGRVSSDAYEYNKLVTLTSSNDPYLWAKAQYDDEAGCIRFYVLSYGSDTYSFYACQSFTEIDDANWSGIVAITQQEYEMILSNTDVYLLYDTNGEVVVPETTPMGSLILNPQPVVSVLDNVIRKYDSSGNLSKMSLIGTFAIPSGYEIVETGFLFTTTTDLGRDALKIENVGSNGIARMKCARYTVGNQFVVNVMAPKSTVSFDYVGYAVVKNTSTGEITTVYSTVGGERNFDPSV